MTPKLSSLLRSGLIALGVTAGISAPAFAVPITAGLNPAVQPMAQDRGTGIILIQREFRGDGPYSRRGDGRRYWRRNWDRGDRYGGRYGGRYWGHGGHYRRHWRRNYRRGWYDNDWYGGSGIYFGLGFPGYGYYDPFYAPRYYAPRRVYRSGNAHVQWCYNRYRSYREYDNTFQPYNGPRRQCWSPYS